MRRSQRVAIGCMQTLERRGSLEEPGRTHLHRAARLDTSVHVQLGGWTLVSALA
jgi:hypothetical protein